LLKDVSNSISASLGCTKPMLWGLCLTV
jgi:hypothetical protein